MQVNHHFVPGLVEVLIPFRTISSEEGPKGGGAHQGVLEKKFKYVHVRFKIQNQTCSDRP